MSKHNNSLGANSAARCYCGRYASNAEVKAVLVIPYRCPDCSYRDATKRLQENQLKKVQS